MSRYKTRCTLQLTPAQKDQACFAWPDTRVLVLSYQLSGCYIPAFMQRCMAAAAATAFLATDISSAVAPQLATMTCQATTEDARRECTIQDADAAAKSRHVAVLNKSVDTPSEVMTQQNTCCTITTPLPMHTAAACCVTYRRTGSRSKQSLQSKCPHRCRLCLQL
jgi:hypothetical protein